MYIIQILSRVYVIMTHEYNYTWAWAMSYNMRTVQKLSVNNGNLHAQQIIGYKLLLYLVKLPWLHQAWKHLQKLPYRHTYVYTEYILTQSHDTIHACIYISTHNKHSWINTHTQHMQLLIIKRCTLTKLALR